MEPPPKDIPPGRFVSPPEGFHIPEDVKEERKGPEPLPAIQEPDIEGPEVGHDEQPDEDPMEGMPWLRPFDPEKEEEDLDKGERRTGIERSGDTPPTKRAAASGGATGSGGAETSPAPVSTPTRTREFQISTPPERHTPSR